MIDINQEIELRRRYFKDSGYLESSNSSLIDSGAYVIINLDERFKPYDDVQIINLSILNNCTVTINYNFSQPLPKANSLNISVPVREIKITNNGSTAIAINEIKVYYRNTGYKGRETLSYLGSGAQVGTFIWGIFK